MRPEVCLVIRENNERIQADNRMAKLANPIHKSLFVCLAIYCLASLVHFIHNAEFLSAYPGLPANWTRTGVYLVWFGMTAVGALGWSLLHFGRKQAGLVVSAVYACFGLDSLAHYVVAPMSAHTVAMNVTIFMEVGAALLVLLAIGWQAWRNRR